MIDLSIIIPHYNSIKTLERLLKTIPENEKIEIIIVDDKSDKDTEHIKSFKKEIRYRENILFLKNNTTKKGAGVCRNIGIENAKGKWLLFADADDFFLENFLLTIRKFFQYDVDVVFLKPTSIEINSGNLSDRHLKYSKLLENYLKDKSLKTEVKLRYEFFVPWSKLIRRELVKKNNIYFDEVIAANDVMFSTKIGYYMKKFIISKDIIYCVTRDFGTLTTNKSSDVYNARLNVHIEYCKFLKGRLDKKELKYLSLTGHGPIVNALKYKIGIKNVYKVIRKLKRNNVKIIDIRYSNPITLIKKVKKLYNKYLIDKKYMS